MMGNKTDHCATVYFFLYLLLEFFGAVLIISSQTGYGRPGKDSKKGNKDDPRCGKTFVQEGRG